MGISPIEFYEALIQNGTTFFTGVPDSLLKHFCACIEDRAPADKHIIAANEGNAIALAAGYHLGTGEIPCVYMQNSGLANALNPLLSLCDIEIYSIPMIIIIGWRGEPGIKDAVQHVKDGRIQLALLKAVEIPFEVISREEPDINGKVYRGIETATSENRPFVILVKKGTFTEYQLKVPDSDDQLMLREEALEVILDRLPEECVVVSTTGKTSREVFEIRAKIGESHGKDFLTVGSMGHCSSIALGLALANPLKPVVCIDGDGALIMHMGCLATIGKVKPKNFKHVLINNHVHESVGGQETAAKIIDIPNLVKSNGYKNIFSVRSKDQLRPALDKFIHAEGPSFLEILVKPGSRANLSRPSMTPGANKKAFMDYIQQV